jgi:hypothetical protein
MKEFKKASKYDPATDENKEAAEKEKF